MKKDIVALIANSKKYLSDYWEKTLLQRLPGGAGSYILGIQTKEELENLLKELKWEKYNHPNIKPPAHGYKATLPSGIKGVLGIIKLSHLPSDTPVLLDDRKNTGKISAVVELPEKQLPEVNYIVLIAGPHPEKPEVEVVWTFHPGDPIRPSEVETDPSLVNKTVFVKEALALGLEWAKVSY